MALGLAWLSRKRRRLLDPAAAAKPHLDSICALVHDVYFRDHSNGPGSLNITALVLRAFFRASISESHRHLTRMPL